MAKVGRPTIRSCAICGMNRSVDRAHLIPRRIAVGVIGLSKYKDYDGINIVPLCKNHHFLFDSNRLNDDEWGKLSPYFLPLMSDILNLLNSNLIPVRNKSSEYIINETKKKERMIRKWSEMLCFRKIIQKNV